MAGPVSQLICNWDLRLDPTEYGPRTYRRDGTSGHAVLPVLAVIDTYTQRQQVVEGSYTYYA